MLFAVFLDLQNLAVESLDVVLVDDQEGECVYIWLLVAGASEIVEHIFVLGHVGVYQSFGDCLCVIHKLAPVVELVCKMVFDRVGHSFTTSQTVLFKAIVAQEDLLLETVETRRLIGMRLDIEVDAPVLLVAHKKKLFNRFRVINYTLLQLNLLLSLVFTIMYLFWFDIPRILGHLVVQI